MMSSKALLLSAYLALLVIAYALPFALRPGIGAPLVWRSRLSLALSALLLALAVGLIIAQGTPALTSPLILSLFFVVPLVPLGLLPALGAVIALALFATVTWWNPTLQLGLIQGAVFVGLGMLASAMSTVVARREGVPLLPTVVIVTLVGLVAILAVGGFATPSIFSALWHHWSVYVAAAEAMLGGAIPFQDFPVQYGFGPMALVAAVCGKECWSGTYVAVAITNLLYLVAMCCSVQALTRQLPRSVALLCVVAMVCAVLLWTGYPPDEVGPMFTPSVNGMRFGPLALMLLLILVAEVHDRRLDPIGYGLWLVGLIWSPEAAFHVTVVWFSYLGLRAVQVRGSARRWAMPLAILHGPSMAIGALLIAVPVLVLLFHAGFGEWPSLLGYTAYIRNPPGVMPPNPVGPVWFGLGTVAVGLVALLFADQARNRSLFVCLLGALAAGSYYLGRSHDNNLLNLLPFIVLVLTAALSSGLSGVALGFARASIVATIAWCVTFGSSSWAEAWRSGGQWKAGPAPLIEDIKFTTPHAWMLLDRQLSGTAHAASADAGEALAWLRQAGSASPLWINPMMLLPYWDVGNVWTGMNDPASYAFLPVDEVERFIRNGAKSLNRPGRILIDTAATPTPWLDLFAKAYEVTEERKFGSYTVYSLVPRRTE